MILMYSVILTLFVLPETSNAACGADSKCIPITECAVYYNLLQAPTAPYSRALIKSLICDTDNIKICCPPNELVTVDKINLPSLQECGIQTADRIVGGTMTELDEHPWLTLIRYTKSKGWGFYCAGVLITSRHVMTAAHCLKLPYNWTLSHVRLGEWNISSARDCIQLSSNSNDKQCTSGIVDVEVKRLIPHEEYSTSDVHQQNDIALLELARDVEFNDYIRPICLPLTAEQRTNPFNDYDMEVAGWGKTEKQPSSEVKLKAEVPVVRRDKCAEIYNRADRQITEKQICAGGKGGVDSCRGDSGGALMTQIAGSSNWYAIGVVSYGPSPCGSDKWPGVYTRVGYYIDWIKNKLSS